MNVGRKEHFCLNMFPLNIPDCPKAAVSWNLVLLQYQSYWTRILEKWRHGCRFTVLCNTNPRKSYHVTAVQRTECGNKLRDHAYNHVGFTCLIRGQISLKPYWFRTSMFCHQMLGLPFLLWFLVFDNQMINFVLWVLEFLNQIISFVLWFLAR